MIIYQKNLHNAQEFQKRAYDKDVKSRSYAPSEKLWLNNKYIKTKHNWKLEARFFKLFQVLYLVEKQAYNLELPSNRRIHDVLLVSLLEQNTIRKKQEFLLPEFEPGDDKKYKVEAIQNSTVYVKKVDEHLPGLYYLVAWKSYSKEENTPGNLPWPSCISRR